MLVAEFMLQQTPVSRVLAFYQPFLERYPSIGALAKARPSAVREAWDGLGYYRRAADLHRLACDVLRHHGGVVPSEPAALMELPGVGAYTAGAVATFAYEKRAAAVDTNVARVLGRVFGAGSPAEADRKTPSRRDARGGGGHTQAPGQRARELREMAAALQPRRGRTAWEFNQALMELGALLCTARKPRCEKCPVSATCEWYERRAPPPPCRPAPGVASARGRTP